MRAQTARIDRASVNQSTIRALTQGNHILKLAEAFTEDADSYERRKDQLCCTCFYLRRGRIAGQAFTNRFCGACGKDMVFSTTATDVLCPECAKKLRLCERCGADIEFNVRRKLDLPKPTAVVVETETAVEPTMTVMLLPVKEGS